MEGQIDTLSKMLDRSCGIYAALPALAVVGGKPFCYAELQSQVQKLSFWIISHVFERTDRIAIIGENSPNWVVAFFAVCTINRIAVPLLPDFSAVEISNILEHSGSRLLFISKRVYERIGQELKFNGLMVLLDEYRLLSDKKSIFESEPTRMDLTAEQPDPDDVAEIIYTSGTTGRSKGVMLTHKNLTFEMERVLSIQDVGCKDVFLSLLPLSHVYEGVLGMMLPLRQGASIYYISKVPTPSILMNALLIVRPTMLLIVPLIIDKIYHQRIKPVLYKNRILKGAMHIWPIRIFLNNKAGKKLKAAFGGRLRFLGVGGASLNSMTERFLRDARFPYSCGYGLTETSSLIFASKVGKVKFQSVGKPLPGLEYRIVKAQPKDLAGEVIVRWNGNMKGYYKQPEATASVLTADNWFHTGDLAQIYNGNLYIRGRSKTMILGPSGENIYPEEIESVLNRMEGVIESLVFETKGKIVAKVYMNTTELSQKYAFFKNAASYHSAEIHAKISQYLIEMKNQLNSHLGRYSQVSKLELVDKPFEKTATNKIRRHPTIIGPS